MDLTTALQSGGIMLREGLEAILIITILTVFLKKNDAGDRVYALYAGAAAAIMASFGAAWLIINVFSEAANEALEGTVMLLAAGLLFYICGWLFVRQDPKKFKVMLETQALKASGAKTVMPLVVLSFLCVFREGAETILMLKALAISVGGWNTGLITGLLVATTMLCGLYFVLQNVAMRLPLRPLFVGTSALLFVIGVHFLGGGLHELQEIGLIPETKILFAGSKWNVEMTAAQLLAIVIAACSGWFYLKNKPATPATQPAELKKAA